MSLRQFPDDCEKEDFLLIGASAGRALDLSDTRVKQESAVYFG
jgi:hypothetical protein